MKILLIFFTAIFAVQSVPLESEWSKFKVYHDKNYTPTEDHLRFSIYQNNLKTIEEHNRKYQQGLVTYKMGINQFADWTTEEFAQSLKKIPKSVKKIPTATPNFKGVLPDAVNWVEKGAVSPVTDEGQCSSEIYSIVGTVEGSNFVKHKKFSKFSEQCLKDCTTYGCNGGTIDDSFNFIANNGLPLETDYPDPILASEDCKYGEWDSSFWVQDWLKFEDGNETILQYATAFSGPVSVQIDASGFQFYTSGIYYDAQCSTEIFNHAVLVVGYGREGNLDYWIVKNSWGRYWGEDGYIRMSRNKNNQCGIASSGLVPVAI